MNDDDAPAPDLAGTQLVRRMGHDFNNLFSIVLGGMSLLREEIPRSAWSTDANETYEDIMSAAREAADVVARLTAWAGRQALDPQHIDLHAVANDVAHATGARSDLEVEIRVHGSGAPASAWVDRVHLMAAIGELVGNASDAMPGGGTVLIEVDAGAGPGVCVVDGGPGMTPDVLAACREPYYTTRGNLGRRGLGLCVVDGFARASGGALHIDSQPGRGTRATIRLPTGR